MKTVRLEEFTTAMRNELRSFDKFMRQDAINNPDEAILAERPVNEWLDQFMEYMR